MRQQLVRNFILASLPLFLQSAAPGQSNVAVRVMASNLTGNSQTYGATQIRILQGLKPDVLAIQEFNYAGNSAGEIRTFVDTAFGTNFSYFRESGYSIPNGIISRWPILSAGSWDDTEIPDRGFAWAQIDLPSTNDLYVVSVHLSSGGGSSTRATQAANLKTLIQANFPANAWIIVAGDMNTDTRSETALDTFTTFLSDNPIPTDEETLGDPDTNLSRQKPYDYVLPSFSLTNRLTNVVFASRSFSKGLVFDSRVYSPLTDVAPVQSGDSTNGQHMAVVKDFLILSATNPPVAPSITSQPQSQTNAVGTLAHFAVGAAGAAPLSYQWRFNGTNIASATSVVYDIASVQLSNAGNYTVVITNTAGSVTSAVAQLVIASSPQITGQPQSLTVNAGENATFNVTASGDLPLSYQWRFAGANIANATASSFTRTNAQPADAGNYSVVITNISGSVTSVIATLTVNTVFSGPVLARWDFNSQVSDSTPGTGTRATVVGNGTNSYVGGTAAAGSGEFATGSSSDTNTTDNSAWNTSSYPASTSNNKNAGVQFNASTSGRQNIVIAWASQASSTGSRYGRLQFSTNGLNFQDFPTAFTNATAFTSKTNSLTSFPGVNNNASFAFRLVTEFESTATGSGSAAYVAANTGNTYGTGGTVRFDMVTVFGDVIPVQIPPPAAAVLSAPTVNGGQFSMVVTGTVGTNYVVQATTNLTPVSWISLATNASPFTFTNASSLPARFFRAVWLP